MTTMKNALIFHFSFLHSPHLDAREIHELIIANSPADDQIYIYYTIKYSISGLTICEWAGEREVDIM